jgi:copper chaperone CopZ
MEIIISPSFVLFYNFLRLFNNKSKQSKMKKSIVASGGIFAALLASTCCVTPLLALAGALGIGVAQLSFLISIKPYLITVSLFAIAYNLYKAYKPAKNSCCAVPDNKTSAGGKIMKSKVFLWAIAIFTIIILMLPYMGMAQAKVKSTQVQKKIVKTEYYSEKLTQSCCIAIVEYSLKKVDGYEKLEANTEKRLLTVWYDANKTNAEKIKEAINKTPYKAVINKSSK